MGNVLDSTGLGYLISKIKTNFWPKTETTQIALDDNPTSGSQNFVKSGGVYSEIHPTKLTTNPSGGFLPNVEYDLGALSGSVTFSLNTYGLDSNVTNIYYWTFETGANVPTITWPSGLIWPNGTTPTIISNKHYEFSVLNNICMYIEV